MFHESLTATTDMAVLPCVLGHWPLRRTIQVRLGINPAVPRDGCPWHAHLRGLVTPIHETSGLGISHRVLNPYPVLQKPALDWKRLASLRLLTHDFFQGSYSLFRVRSHSVVSVDFRVSDDAFLIDN